MLLQIFSSLLGWVGPGLTPQNQQSSGDTKSNPHQQDNPNGGSSNFFTGAHDFVITQPIMVDKYTTINNFQTGRTVLEILLPSVVAGAAVDSSARDPPPRCHPGTREAIVQRLRLWSSDEQRRWNMVWMHGPAGVGKSAVAQTFAEDCQTRGCFGAAFFFSKLKGFNKPIHVIPTLVYQLAVNVPGYKTLLTQELANDPAILEMAIHIQFRRLIVDLFSALHHASSSARPFVVILDGLDECEGEDEQCGIIEMISEAVRLRNDLPLLWLICSRPESHFKRTFSRADFKIHCGKEDLIIDDDTRADVERYLRDGFQNICTKYQDLIALEEGEAWPDERAFKEICDASSGLFVLASMAVNYIGDPEYADPRAQLVSFLSFIKGIHSVGAKSPLAALDILYTRILADVPVHILPVTMRILGFGAYELDVIRYFMPLSSRSYILTTQALSNFLRLDRGTFYGSLRKLHSVVNVAPPESASDMPFTFYHASFRDYLQNPQRSGKFAILIDDIWTELAKCSLYWYDLILRDRSYGLASQRLTWAAANKTKDILQMIHEAVRHTTWLACAEMMPDREIDAGLAAQLQDFDYSLLPEVYGFYGFANWAHELMSNGLGAGLGDNFVRAHVHYPEVDAKLLSYLSILAGSEPIYPASFPIGPPRPAKPTLQCERVYFFIGHGSKSCLYCVSFGGTSRGEENLTLKTSTRFGGKQRHYLDWEGKEEGGIEITTGTS